MRVAPAGSPPHAHARYTRPVEDARGGEGEANNNSKKTKYTRAAAFIYIHFHAGAAAASSSSTAHTTGECVVARFRGARRESKNIIARARVFCAESHLQIRYIPDGAPRGVQEVLMRLMMRARLPLSSEEPLRVARGCVWCPRWESQQHTRTIRARWKGGIYLYNLFFFFLRAVYLSLSGSMLSASYSLFPKDIKKQFLKIYLIKKTEFLFWKNVPCFFFFRWLYTIL